MSPPKSKFSSLTPVDSHFVQSLQHMSEEEMLQKLGYGDALKAGGMEKAAEQFRQDHHNAAPTHEKLKEVLEHATEQKEAFAKMGATGITVQQAYSIGVGSARTGVPENAIARLAIAERAFDKGFTSQDRQPGLIQMRPHDFLETFRTYGADCSHTADLAREIPRDAKGKPEPVEEWPESFKKKVLAKQGDPQVSAQLGTEYAKTHPVQLDIIQCYDGATAADNRDQLSALMKNVGHLSDSEINTVLSKSKPEWCAAMVGSALVGSGRQPQKNGEGLPTIWGPDYEKYGTRVSPDKVTAGDVVVFNSGHVAMVNSLDGNGNFSWWGGNQAASSSVNLDSGEPLNTPGLTFVHPPKGAFAEAAPPSAPARKPSKPAPSA